MCEPLSQPFKVKLLLFQELAGKFNHGIHSGTDLCSGEATAAVCPHFFFYKEMFKHVNILVLMSVGWNASLHMLSKVNLMLF